MTSSLPTKTGAAASRFIPVVIIDENSRKEYVHANFLGKGAYAKCYEFRPKETNMAYAGKIVSKALLMNPRQNRKIPQEIQIHKSQTHQHILGFHGYFEDDNHVYIIMELCRRGSLKEIHIRRGSLTKPEDRYFLRQLLMACQYLVQECIIYRDIKLGSLLLNDAMKLQVGEFGLSAHISCRGELRMTFCGTSNYIASEVLAKWGHSFEVDVWFIGVIL